MAYHIFTLRKLMLTNRMNNLNLQMMNVQFEREKIEDELLGLWDQYYGYTGDSETAEGINIEEAQEEAGVADTSSTELTDAQKNNIKAEIRHAQAEEDHLDQLLKKYETKYSEAQNELKSVETQEAQAIQASTPKYGGVGQQG